MHSSRVVEILSPDQLLNVHRRVQSVLECAFTVWEIFKAYDADDIAANFQLALPSSESEKKRFEIVVVNAPFFSRSDTRIICYENNVISPNREG